MTGPLPAHDGTAADMVMLRTSPPANPEPATDLLRRWVTESFADDDADARYFVLVDVAAEDPHRALAAVLVVNDPRPGVARLAAIAVEPAVRHQGLATRLISDVRRALHARGETLALCTNADPQLTNMLRRLGFAEDTGDLNSDYASEPVGRPVRWLSRDT